MTPRKAAINKRYYTKNREYYKLYQRRYRAMKRGGLGPLMDICPGCGHRKMIGNDICKRCSAGSPRRVMHRESRVLQLGCVACSLPMTEFRWHGKRMFRCSACGLELRSPTVFMQEAA